MTIFRMCVSSLLSLAVCVGVSFAGSEKSPHSSTHKQTRIIRPLHDGKPIALNTFCLSRSGDILACVGGDTVEYLPGEDGSFETKTVKAPKLLQKYSPAGKLIAEVELDFKPTAINEAADETIYVAGVGRVAHISKDCKILTAADSPHIGDLDELKKTAAAAAEEQMKEMTGSLTEQTERISKMLEKLEAKPEEELTDREKKRMKTLEQQKKMYCDQEKQMAEAYEQFFSVDAMMARSMEITSLAVTAKDVFLCCGSTGGHGYEVWRTDLEFSSPTKVVDSLGGCCGQCDIQANDDYLVLAENTKFQVGLLDRDGKRVSSFGKQDRTSKEGFASCCNPMNVRCCDNGDILTAESSIGYIKRWNSDGEFLGTVGKAKIGGGCKHVALGYDQKKDHYYMQYQDRNQICVLVPNAEAPEFTKDELLAKEAMDGLGQKLIGDGEVLTNEWSLTGKPPAAKKAGGAGLFESLIASALGSGKDEAVEDDSDDDGETELSEVDVEEMMMSDQVSYFKFEADGGLKIRGTYSEDSENSWEAISQDVKANKFRFAHLEEGIQYYDYEVEFINDTTAKFSVLYSDQVMSSQTYHRIPKQATKASPAVTKPVEGELQESDTEFAEEKITEEQTTEGTKQ